MAGGVANKLLSGIFIGSVNLKSPRRVIIDGRGFNAHHIRAMAEALGKNPPASRYTADMSKHYALGNDARLVKENMDFAEKL